MQPSHVPLGATSELARFAIHSRFDTLPASVAEEIPRAFLNWMGCALGGCREPAVQIAADVVAETGGRPQAGVVGQALRTDVAHAAFINCISSSVMAFDDAHLKTVTHPSGPIAASLLACSEYRAVSGADFVNALALGMEITCRLSNALVLPPSRFNVGFYVTGLTAPIGVAAAVGKLLGLDERGMVCALGIAASQAAGFRATHGTMTAHFRPGHAARSGIWAALLAAKGFDSDPHALEASHGFADVFAAGADLARALRGMGEEYELLSNAYKPYPCGIVIHPTIDACLEIRAQCPPGVKVAQATLRVHPLAIQLTGVRSPSTPLESHVSVYHWAAAALTRGAAGLPETRQQCIDDPDVLALRDRIEAVADPAVGREQAVVDVVLTDGRALHAHTLIARGSAALPMSDSELDAKFVSQASTSMPEKRVEELRRLCRKIIGSGNVGADVSCLLW